MTLPDPDAWPVADPLADPSVDLLRERARSTPERTAVVESETGEQWTYGSLDDRVDARANGLAALLGAPDRQRTERSRNPRVALVLGTGLAFAGAYFAVGRLGATAVPLNLALSRDRLRAQAERADAAAVVCDGPNADLASDIAPDGTPVVSVDDRREGGTAESGTGGVETVETGEATEPAEVDAVERPLDAERLVVFTSGTTGEPKGVRLTRGNLVASAVGSAFRLGVDPDDRWLVPLPTYHMGGLAPLVRSTLYGTTAVLQREFDTDRTADAFDEFGVTGVSLVPTTLARLLDGGWDPPESLRFVLLGGAPADEALVERAIDRGAPVYPTYGLTETASQVTTALPPEAVEYPGTVGRPLRNVRVSIRGLEDRAHVETGDTGEVVVDGPTVTPGYLDDERTAAAFGPHGHRTGDVGYRDADGRLWVVGRVDDRIVTGGENVHPERVVDALRGVDGVADAAVVSLPDEEWGERIAALVVREADARVTAETVRERLRGSLADFEVPKTVGFADELPRTASGTVDRQAVRDRLRGSGS